MTLIGAYNYKWEGKHTSFSENAIYMSRREKTSSFLSFLFYCFSVNTDFICLCVFLFAITFGFASWDFHILFLYGDVCQSSLLSCGSFLSIVACCRLSWSIISSITVVGLFFDSVSRTMMLYMYRYDHSRYSRKISRTINNEM